MSTGGKSFQDSSLALRHCVVSLLSWQPSCPHSAAVCPAVLGWCHACVYVCVCLQGCVCICLKRDMSLADFTVRGKL